MDRMLRMSGVLAALLWLGCTDYVVAGVLEIVPECAEANNTGAWMPGA